MSSVQSAADLLQAFRHHYHTFEGRILEAIGQSADSNVFDRLRDDLAEFEVLVHEVCQMYLRDLSSNKIILIERGYLSFRGISCNPAESWYYAGRHRCRISARFGLYSSWSPPRYSTHPYRWPWPAHYPH